MPEKLNSVHLTKIIIQALEEMGYLESARCLELESGISVMADCDAEDSLNLKYSVVDGKWDSVGAILDRCDWASGYVRYPLLRQKFLELLAAGRWVAAANCLHTELEPAITTKGHRSDFLNLARVLLLRPRHDELCAVGFVGSGLAGRVKAAEAALQSAPPHLKFPASRLRRLLAQVSWPRSPPAPMSKSRQGSARTSFVEFRGASTRRVV